MNEENVEELQKLEELKRLVLKKILSRPAVERLARIKLVKPQLAQQLELYLVQLYQTGKIGSEISEAQLKQILESLSARKQFRIIR